MKKSIIYLLVFLLATLFVSCSKNAEETPSSIKALTCYRPSHAVSLEDVQSYLLNNKGLPLTRVDEVTIDPIISGLDTVMFLVNYKEGWEVLSGDQRASRVLIKCETGNCSVSDLYSNPSSAQYMTDIERALKAIKADDSFHTPEDISDSWHHDRLDPLDTLFAPDFQWVYDGIQYSMLSSKTKNHLIDTHWGQGSPWNIYMPYKNSNLNEHCYAGCVPVAAGQVLRYLNTKFNLSNNICGSATCSAYIPSGSDYIVLTSSDVSFSDYSTSNWSSMAVDSTSTSGTDKVSALLLYLGYLYNAKFYRTGTGAVTSYATSVFPSFGVSCQYTNTQSNFSAALSILESNIYDNELPVIMSIVDTTSQSGHSVVADGYKYEQKQVYYRYAFVPVDMFGHPIPGFEPKRYRYEEGPIEESTFVAINWGWNGTGDSILGTPIWYNVFNDWVVGVKVYSLKRYIIHSFSVI